MSAEEKVYCLRVELEIETALKKEGEKKQVSNNIH